MKTGKTGMGQGFEGFGGRPGGEAGISQGMKKGGRIMAAERRVTKVLYRLLLAVTRMCKGRFYLRYKGFRL